MTGHNGRLARFLIQWLLGIVIGFGLAGCSNTEIGNPEVSAGWVASFASDGDLEAYLRDRHDAALKSSENLPPGQAAGDGVTGVPVQDISVTFSSEIASDPSRTGDLEAKDGPTTFVAGNREVVVLDAEGADAGKPVAVIPAPGDIRQILLRDSLLMIVSQQTGGMSGGPETIVQTADVSRPEATFIVESLEIEGEFIGLLHVSGRIHLVLRFLPDLSSVSRGTTEGLAFDDLIPHVTHAAGDRRVSERLLAPENVHHPAFPLGGAIFSLVRFDAADLGVSLSAVGLVADITALHFSADALYLAAVRKSAGGDATDVFRLDLLTDPPAFSAAGRLEGGLKNAGFMNGADAGLQVLIEDTLGSCTTFCDFRQVRMRAEAGELKIVFDTVFSLPFAPVRARFTGDRVFLYSSDPSVSVMSIRLDEPFPEAEILDESPS